MILEENFGNQIPPRYMYYVYFPYYSLCFGSQLLLTRWNLEASFDKLYMNNISVAFENHNLLFRILRVMSLENV
jgi:hypothetical protein